MNDGADLQQFIYYIIYQEAHPYSKAIQNQHYHSTTQSSNQFMTIDRELYSSFCSQNPKCQIKLYSFLPAYLDTSRLPKIHTGYSQEAMFIVKLFSTVLALPNFWLEPSEKENFKDSSLLSEVRVPNMHLTKLLPFPMNYSSLYCFSLLSLSFFTQSPPFLFPVQVI